MNKFYINIAIAFISIIIIVGLFVNFIISSYNKFSASTALNSSSNFSLESINISVPIYVVNSKTLLEQVVNAFKTHNVKVYVSNISLSQLDSTPNDSIVIISWSEINSSIIMNLSSKSKLNLTSKIISEISNLINRGDIVSLYGNVTYSNVIQFILSYSWAKAFNNKLLLGINPKIKALGYLFAYPKIPLSLNEPVLFIAKAVKSSGLIIGPIYLDQLPNFVLNVENSSGMNLLNSNNPKDPCYEEYQEYENSSNWADSSTFIWAASQWLGQSNIYYGIPAYSDGNGTFYWDSCLIINKQIADVENLYSIPMTVVGYENYYESQTMYYNGGEVVRQTGAIDYYHGYQMYQQSEVNSFVSDPGGGSFSSQSWNPQPTGAASQYTIIVGLEGVTPIVEFEVTWSGGPKESITGSYNGVSLNMNNQAVPVYNITWDFNINQNDENYSFYNVFNDVTPPGIVLPNFSPLNNYNTTINVDFSNYAYTTSNLCGPNTTESIWTDTSWIINIYPQSSTSADIPSTSGIILTSSTPETPPNAYITGVSSQALQPWYGCIVPGS